MISQKKILLVDDEQINLDFFELMLSRLGFVIYRAENGREALDSVRQHSPDLVILDNIMPVMSGWEFTRLLKFGEEFSPWRETPVIMFSALDDVKNKIEGFELGVDDYITKPFNFAEVLARIKAVLRTHELIDQLKKREERLEVEYKVNACLLRHVDDVSALLKSVYESSDSTDVCVLKRMVGSCLEKCDELKTEITVLEEKGRMLKNSEIEVQSLEKELRKAYSN